MTYQSPLRVSDLPQNAPTRFELRPTAQQQEAIRQELGLEGLRKLSFSGDLRAQAKRDWLLSGVLGATVVQPCVITLDPVTTRIDIPSVGSFWPTGRTPMSRSSKCPKMTRPRPSAPRSTQRKS